MNSEWLKEQLEIARLRKENLDIAEQKGLFIIEVFDSHIEVRDKDNNLRKVFYSQHSLNFYLKSVKAYPNKNG